MAILELLSLSNDEGDDERSFFEGTGLASGLPEGFIFDGAWFEVPCEPFLSVLLCDPPEDVGEVLAASDCTFLVIEASDAPSSEDADTVDILRGGRGEVVLLFVFAIPSVL